MITTIPPFEPHPLLRGGHAQTIAGRYLPGRRFAVGESTHDVDLGDGDQLRVVEATPAGWKQGDPAIVLVHGLGGDANAPYMVRICARLVHNGFRVVSMNLRGAGAGFGLAKGIYHAGRTGDLRILLEWLAPRTPGSPIGLIGFSLGANMVLKLAGEASEQPIAGLDCVLAANPPVDLSECAKTIRKPANRLYDRNFVNFLMADVRRLHRHFPELGPVPQRVRGISDFDDRYTAPRNGFAGVEDYYAKASSAPFVPRIQVPGLIVHAEDDPFIPAETLRRLDLPPSVELEMSAAGGHLGYISRSSWDGDRRWLDSRLTHWLRSRWSIGSDRTRG